MGIWLSLLTSKLHVLYAIINADIYRQNPAVISQAGKVFVFIAQALEAETLQGQTATRIVASAKTLLQVAGLDPQQVLAQLSPETQQTVRAYFG
jgi:hypothetical protein